MGDQPQRQTAIERLRMLKADLKKSDWWNEITEEEKTAIDKGLADIKGWPSKTS